MRRSLSVILDDEIHELLRDASAMEGKSISQIIREVVRKEVRRRKIPERSNREGLRATTEEAICLSISANGSRQERYKHVITTG